MKLDLARVSRPTVIPAEVNSRKSGRIFPILTTTFIHALLSVYRRMKNTSCSLNGETKIEGDWNYSRSPDCCPYNTKIGGRQSEKNRDNGIKNSSKS